MCLKLEAEKKYILVASYQLNKIEVLENRIEKKKRKEKRRERKKKKIEKIHSGTNEVLLIRLMLSKRFSPHVNFICAISFLYTYQISLSCLYLSLITTIIKDFLIFASSLLASGGDMISLQAYG